MKSKQKTNFALIAIAVVALLFLWGKSGYNRMVKLDESLSTAWSQVENVYQRRADLIPNLVATVKGYAAHESETLQAVVDARAKATQTNIDPSNMSTSQFEQFQSGQQELTQALGKLMVVVERYPELKANENFRDLQVQLEGSENRITVERQKFNEAARAYNTEIRSFPKNILASLFGFEKRGYFEAKAGADEAPVVTF
ncbi:MAG: LemA family protein [Bacteroidales bacterium]